MAYRHVHTGPNKLAGGAQLGLMIFPYIVPAEIDAIAPNPAQANVSKMKIARLTVLANKEGVEMFR